MDPDKKAKILFPKTGQACEVDLDDTLVDATFRYDLPIRYRCERAVCTTCLTEVLEGMENLSEMEEREKQTLSAIKADSHWRLACQVSVLGDVKLDYIPVTDARRQSGTADSPV
jgi:ferredoxin